MQGTSKQEPNRTSPIDAHERDEVGGHRRRSDKLYDIQHWRDYTSRVLDGTSYGYDPAVPPLTLDQLQKLPFATQYQVLGAVSGALAGEYIAFEVSAALVGEAPDEAARKFMATQVLDEARHVESLTHRLNLLGCFDIDETLKRYVTPGLFRFHDLMRERYCTQRGDFHGALVGQNLALEGLALGFFEFHAGLLRDVDPGTSQVIDAILHDERRHVGFGLVRLSEHLDVYPGQRMMIQDVVNDLCGRMMEILEENADRMAHVGVDAADAMSRVKRYHRNFLHKLAIG